MRGLRDPCCRVAVQRSLQPPNSLVCFERNARPSHEVMSTNLLTIVQEFSIVLW